MFTQIEETIPLLSKKEFIMLELAKSFIISKKADVIGTTPMIQDANRAADLIISLSKTINTRYE